MSFTLSDVKNSPNHSIPTLEMEIVWLPKLKRCPTWIFMKDCVPGLMKSTFTAKDLTNLAEIVQGKMDRSTNITKLQFFHDTLATIRAAQAYETKPVSSTIEAETKSKPKKKHPIFVPAPLTVDDFPDWFEANLEIPGPSYDDLPQSPYIHAPPSRLYLTHSPMSF